MLASFAQKKHPSMVGDCLLLGVLFSVLFLLFLGAHPLLSPDETRYVGIAWDMFSTGEYITPTIAGSPFLGKPILFYWGTIAAYHLFGVTDFAARFFPAMLGVLSCLIAYLFGRLVYDRLTGWLMSLMLAASPLFFAFTHYANMDGEVASWLTCALLSFLIADHQMQHQKGASIWLWLSYVFSAAAFLTKGLIGFIFPGMIILAWVFFLKDWRLFLRIRLGTGVLLFVVLVMPWLLLCEQTNPGFMQYFFVDNQFVRFVGTHFNNQQPFYFYLPFLVGGVFPFTVYLLQALVAHCSAVATAARAHRARLFLVLWLVLVALFFSIPGGKPIGHIAPAMPPVALLLALYVARHWQQVPSKLNQCAHGLLSIVFIGLAVLLLSCDRLYQLAPDVVPFAHWVAVLLLMAATLLIVFLLTKKTLAYSAGMLLAMTIIVNVMFIASLKHWPLQYNWPIAKKTLALQAKNPTAEVVMFGRYYYALPLYLTQPVAVVSNWNQLQLHTLHDNWQREIFEGVAERPNAWPKTLIDETAFQQQLFTLNQPLIVIMPTSELPYLDAMVGRDVSVVASVPKRHASIVLIEPLKEEGCA